jgi:Type II secretion system (T2SS), protein E, N-terminal domain
MPFLTRAGQAEGSQRINVVPGMSDGVVWDDQYRPSVSHPGVHGNLRQQRRLCGSPECSGGWTMPWRSRRRPIFEGQWGCSGRCVLAMVRAAVRGEQSDGTSHVAFHRHRVPLGLVMLAQGWITHPQLQSALAAQRESGSGRIGDWLIRECGVEADKITRGLSLQWGCPVLTTEGFSPETMSLVMPRIFVEEFEVLPLRVAGSRILYLGSSNRLDAATALALEQMTELKVESGVVDGGCWPVRVLSRKWSRSTTVMRWRRGLRQSWSRNNRSHLALSGCISTTGSGYGWRRERSADRGVCRAAAMMPRIMFFLWGVPSRNTGERIACKEERLFGEKAGCSGGSGRWGRVLGRSQAELDDGPRIGDQLCLPAVVFLKLLHRGLGLGVPVARRFTREITGFD